MSEKILLLGNYPNLDLEQTFECGQCFRWNRQECGSYRGIAYGRIGEVYIEDNIVKVKVAQNFVDEESEKEFWRYYLDLKRDYGQIKRFLAQKDSHIAKAIKSGEGIHILKQETWETIVSFIISQQKQIPQIKKCVEALARNCGTEAGNFSGEVYYNLPSPKELARLTEDDLKPVGLGYRAPYLIKTAKQITDCGILEKSKRCSENISQWTDLEDYIPILDLSGVGPKVENCIRLFGMGQVESFPIDTWIKKVMNQAYGFAENDMVGMKKFAENQFGEYGGIAQQYLFYHIKKGIDF